jgi:hypothetical protein
MIYVRVVCSKLSGVLPYELEIDNLIGDIQEVHATLWRSPEILLQVVFQFESDFGTV